jgi:glycosyltransferase involved in cell wall biosynthesis
MKILLVAPQPFYVERGTPIAVRLLAESLCDQGHEVDLLVYHGGRDISYRGLRVYRAMRPPLIDEVPIGLSLQKLVCDIFLVARMARLLLRGRYDVIHAVEEAVFPAALFKLLHGCKLVYDMDSSMSEQIVEKWSALRFLGPIMEGAERLAVRRANGVLAVCEDLAAKVRPWVGNDRVTVLPDVPVGDEQLAANVDSLRPMLRPGALLALYVGNLEKYQGIDLLLEGAARVNQDALVDIVVIGGSAEHIAAYQRRAGELGIAGRIHFLGPRPVTDLGGYLAQADILLSPRMAGRNTPMKVYSYMQAGRAILATDIRSHTQALDAGCCELVATEPPALAAGLDRLVRDPDRRQQLGTAARERVEREYSLPVFRAKLAGAYQRLGQS